jgi:DNA repair exonuclease SbcCD ATPase subunit
MKKLRIKRLVLQNFKGIRSLELNFNGNPAASIYGKNEAGKTTVMDAVMWLFFNKDSHGSAKFSIKPLVHGIPESNLEHMVEGVFNDGEKNLTFKKVYTETWTKKRGSLTKEFTGHSTDYYLDDVGTPAKKFNDAVAELTADPDVFQLLSSPTFFSESLPWKKRREMIVDVVGDITDDEVISSDPDLADVPKILDGKSVEDRMTIIAQGKKQINKDIDSLPGRIDEKKRSLPELTVTNADHLVKKLTNLHANLSAQNDKIAQIRTGGGAAEIRNQITAIDGDIQVVKNAYLDEIAKATRSKHAQAETLLSEKSKVSSSRSALESKRINISCEIKQKETFLEQSRKELKGFKESEFTEDSCPTCGQQLPADSVEKARNTFNGNKAEAISRNITKGKETKLSVEKLEAKLEVINTDIDLHDRAIDYLTFCIERIAKEVAAAKPEKALEETNAFIEANQKKAALQKQLENISTTNASLIASETEIKEAIEEDIKTQNGLIAKIEQYNADTLRINELMAEEKKLGAKYEELEGQLYILENFIRAKVALLESKVSEKFGSVGFKLFSPQINGGLTETCEATVNGVPYADLNNAAKIQSGISIINTFAKHYDFHPFIFLDNAESVTHTPETEAQMIKLVVSPEDEVLRLVA